MIWKTCLILILSGFLHGCNEDPRFNVKLYNGRSALLGVERSKTGEVVGCHEMRFDKMTCAWTEELTREARRLQRCCADNNKQKLERAMTAHPLEKTCGDSY